MPGLRLSVCVVVIDYSATPPPQYIIQLSRRRLAGATHATFSVEKAATGLLRILSRLFFRPGLAAPLSVALTWLIPPHLNPWLFESLAGHVSSALRRLVATAPAAGGGGGGGGEGGQGAVGGGAWRAVLSGLEACASVSGGSRAEADAFEAVCLLVHNQDLKVAREGWRGVRVDHHVCMYAVHSRQTVDLASRIPTKPGHYGARPLLHRIFDGPGSLSTKAREARCWVWRVVCDRVDCIHRGH